MISAAPIAEIISIGTELLLGQILDTNTQYLTSELAGLGIDCYFHSTVGDNKDRIKACLKMALDRAGILIITGGLGPTADDLTIECIAEFFSADLLFDDQVMSDIEEKFKKRNFKMPESNRKQALRPKDAMILPNPVGSAPGIIWEVKEELLQKVDIKNPQQPRFIMTFPGVPTEMKVMWKETAVLYFAKQFSPGVIWSCDLKHYGIGESALAEMHGDLLNLANPTVAPLAGSGECRLRVTAKAKTKNEAQALAKSVIEKIRSKSGSLCYGIDDETLASVVGRLLVEKKKTLAAAESCTGGLISKLLTDAPGSSQYVKLNVVTYADEAKHNLLSVPQDILMNDGAVSENCAEAMALGVCRVAKADIGLSITGIAGPGGGTKEKPVGLVYVAMVSGQFKKIKKLQFASDLSRSEIRHRTANEALNMVRLYLLDL